MDYRAYLIDEQGHFLGVHEFDAPNDAAALQQAVKFVDRHDMEVWHRGRRIGRIECRMAAPKTA